MQTQLIDFLSGLTGAGAVVAFSGGVDSTVLLYYALLAAQKSGGKIYAVTFDNGFQSREELTAAAQIASGFGIDLLIKKIDVLNHGELRFNPLNRCYLCKKILFSGLLKIAAGQNCRYVLDGTNFDDTFEHRPGLAALDELGIKSPFRELKLSKQAIRQLAENANLPTAGNPSSPCLATRLPYGTEITPELLQKIESGENLLKGYGFPVVRLRIHGDIARIEVPAERLPELLNLIDTGAIKKLGFKYVCADLDGFRSGSMDR